MITKIGNDALTKEAAGLLGGAVKLIGKGFDFARKGASGLWDLGAGAAKGAIKGSAPKTSFISATAPGGGNITKAVTSTPMQRFKGGLSGAHSGMEAAWKNLGSIPGAQTATAGMGMLGMGMLAGGDTNPAPQYNFYQTGYPQQFSGSWQ